MDGTGSVILNGRSDIHVRYPCVRIVYTIPVLRFITWVKSRNKLQ
jgi:hypothetical protein